ncbi:general secretion pathway protein D [Thermovibrio ammonificans HB-1]|uniref:General secretion pathway protein D n=1 Tax=Thermovibrio ammonificans (strain DSM 15698 / JCM 12110 / HB-1) TaxID=648996 RepID=E8T1W8_THEA1|nr:type II secretion system secretin GspD [Thermovibrio ammonificans]ADU96863.1 general secretion pathway protein D [Thermovibrio ammonificans HB-1]
MVKRTVSAALLAASAVLVAPIQPPLLAQEPKSVQVNFVDVDIKDFTKVVSQATGKNIIVPPTLRGKITIISPKPIPKKELFDLFVAALDELGYQVVNYKDYVKIVRNREVARESTTVLTGRVDGGDIVVTYIYIPRHLYVMNLQGLIRNMLSPVGRVSFVRESNAVVITDKEKNVHRIVKVLSRLDRAPLKLKIASYTFKNAKAQDVVKVLQALLEKGFAFDIAKTFPLPGREYYHFAVDGRTNTLYVVGTPKTIVRVLQLCEKLDRPIKVKEGDIHIIKLNYAFAEDMAKVLDSLFKDTSQKKFGLSGPVKVVADKGSNSLIVLASPQDFAVVKDVVKSIDVKRPQVFVEVQIVEMSMDKLLQMGVEWKFLSRGNYVPFGGSLYGNLPLQPGYPSASPGLLLGIAKWRDGVPDIGLLLNAYAKEGGVNVIATPQILTLDNEEAEINISKVIPYSTGVKYDTNNNPVISYDYKDVGIVLKITPHITASGEVRLKVYEKVEDVVGYANADQTAPITSKREAKTTVDVHDGQTLVIGGLIKRKKLTTVEKVPVLGSIPVIGNLFKKTGHQIEKTNLLVFITPHIVRNTEEEQALTARKVAEYRENLLEIKRSRKGILSDIKGFGQFELNKGLMVNVKDVK